ncbi:MAG: SAM-dependent methyltransferase [Saprospiraceae bacterium]|nr:SAM-dependent methyltransferase [Saprospiraceae bacterium]
MQHQSGRGALILIPVPIAPGNLPSLPAEVIAAIHRLRFFIVENARTARRLIKSTNPPYRINELTILELRYETSFDLEQLLRPALEGHDVGLMSEAGCPAIADPGAHVVRHAHEQGIEVKPLVGPSSIILALMASGMNGQRFCFLGYLTPKRDKLPGVLRRLESESRRTRTTQIFIEAPYRNQQIYTACLETLSPETLLCVARDLTDPDEYVVTATVAAWRKAGTPDLHKRPAIFLLYAG